jgi:DnaA-like protein
MSAVPASDYVRVSLAQIDAVVAAHLGPARVKGNAQPAVFNRQIAMYLAKHVGRWSTTRIGRFYHGRDHSTVCHAIRKVEALRAVDPTVAALIESLTARLRASTKEMPVQATATTANQASRKRPLWIEDLADAIIERLVMREVQAKDVRLSVDDGNTSSHFSSRPDFRSPTRLS